MALETCDTYDEIKGLVGEVAKKYPPYKDLDPLHEYDIQATIGIHGDILTIIDCLYRHYDAKDENIHEYSDNSRVGISIVNFIHTLEYENTLLHEQISLYTNYISFYHTSQTNYLKKLSLKIHNFQMEIDEEIMINYQSFQVLHPSVAPKFSSGVSPTPASTGPVDMTSFFTIDFFDSSTSTSTTSQPCIAPVNIIFTEESIDDVGTIHQEKEELLSLSETLVKAVEETIIDETLNAEEPAENI